jgi:hypothetical protein
MISTFTDDISGLHTIKSLFEEKQSSFEKDSVAKIKSLDEMKAVSPCHSRPSLMWPLTHCIMSLLPCDILPDGLPAAASILCLLHR